MTTPTSLDHFFTNYHYQILGTAFTTQIFHYQFIKKTESALASSSASSAAPVLSFSSFLKPSSFPRPLKAGLAWAAFFAVLMTKSTLAQKAVRDFNDPVVASSRQKRNRAGTGL